MRDNLCSVNVNIAFIFLPCTGPKLHPLVALGDVVDL